MSYGTLAQIGGRVPRFATSGGTFDGTTRPTSTQVTAMMAQISALIDAFLASHGYVVPVTDGDVTPLLDLFVEDYIAGLVIQTNGSLFVGPTLTKSGATMMGWEATAQAVKTYIDAIAVGLERMGATRTNDIISSIAHRDLDNAGNEVTPLFQRKAFGNVVKDWDTAS